MKNYCQNMETFLFRKAWGEIFQALPDEQAGQLIKAIYAHTNGETVTLEDATLNSILKTLTRELDVSVYKYLRRVGYIDDAENK